MAVDLFLKIEGIKGESQDDKHKDEIEIHSYSFGVDTEGTIFKPGETVAQDFSFVTSVSTASPVLFLAVTTGKHFDSAILTVRKAGQAQQEFLKYSLSDVIITSHHQGAASSSDLLPTDQFSIDFAMLKVEYSRQKPDGSLDSPVIAVWAKPK